MANSNVGATPKQIRMGDEHRLKIANSNILNCLLEHIAGEREMTGTQVTAALGLLKKALPDLQAISVEGNVGLTVTLGSYAPKL